MSIKCDLIIQGGSILTMDNWMSILENQSIAIAGGRILDIYPQNQDIYEAEELIDATGCLVIPGLINTHSHIPMTYFRGLADDLPLDIWLNKYIWPLEAKLINHDFIYDASLHGAAEMIKHGIVLTNDMYFQMRAIADACSSLGLRVIVSEAMIDAKDTAAKHPIGTKLLELKEEFRDNELVSFSLAPHAIYTCGTQTLARVAELAQEHNLLIHSHLSEAEAEPYNCLKEHGMRPVHYLKSLGILESKAVFAHGIWVDNAEMELLAESGASIALCTDSNLKLSSGIAPIKAYRDAGVNLALATDGVASNNNLDLFAEMDFTAKLHKAINRDPSFLRAEEMLRMVTIDAARALGLEDQTGSLEQGKAADLIIIDTENLESQPLYNPYSHLVYAIGAHSVRDTVINGRVVMRDRKLTKVSEQDLIARAKEYKAKLIKEL